MSATDATDAKPAGVTPIDVPRSFTSAPFASNVGDAAHLTALLDADGALLSAKDELSTDPLSWAVRNSRADCVALLLARDADVESKSFGGMRPLHHACASYDEGIIRDLIAKKADPNSVDDGGNTPLHYTSRRCACARHLTSARLFITLTRRPRAVSAQGRAEPVPDSCRREGRRGREERRRADAAAHCVQQRADFRRHVFFEQGGGPECASRAAIRGIP